jgi:hypothetical protein
MKNRTGFNRFIWTDDEMRNNSERILLYIFWRKGKKVFQNNTKMKVWVSAFTDSSFFQVECVEKRIIFIHLKKDT